MIVGAAYLRNSDGKYHLTSFSNTGDGVTIAAPGSRIYGLSSAEEKYTYMSGTSAAAPMVAGVASLVWSVNPSLSGAQVRNIVTGHTVDTVCPYGEEGKNLGLVNAKKAVEAALATKYTVHSVTGEIDTGDYEIPADLITVKSGEKTKDITVISGKIDLISEDCNGTIIINGDYGENEFETTEFSVSGKDVDFGVITFSPKQTE